MDDFLLQAPAGETLEVHVSKRSENSAEEDSPDGLMLAEDVKDAVSKEKLRNIAPELKVSDVYLQVRIIE